jgi:hypothetical protein
MSNKYLFTKKIKLKDKNYFQYENGIWAGNESKYCETQILIMKVTLITQILQKSISRLKTFQKKH